MTTIFENGTAIKNYPQNHTQIHENFFGMCNTYRLQ